MAIERKPVSRSFIASLADFKAGKDTPSAFLERCLMDLDDFEPQIKAFVHYNAASARVAAEKSTSRWRSGRPLSRIDGMPVGVKDIIETHDMPTQMGSPIYKGWQGVRDSATVQSLREAGAVILGKTVTTEFAMLHPNVTVNPWDIVRTPGGSSSGSAAAVACGMVPAALGTQVVGSILRPASFCGCVGFKPSVGAVRRSGSHDDESHSTHGAIAASIEDAWAMLRESVERTGGDPGYPGLIGPLTTPEAVKPKRIAIIETEGWAKATPEARAQLLQAADKLARAGVEMRSRKDAQDVARVEDVIGNAMAVTRNINTWEFRWPFNTYRDHFPKLLSPSAKALLDAGERMTLEDYRKALSDRFKMRSGYAQLAEECDVAISLSATGAAPVGLKSTGDASFLAAGSCLGVPAISLPLLSDEGLPLGLQVLGFRDKDAALISHARWIMNCLSR